jgi:hypothetical protein
VFVNSNMAKEPSEKMEKSSKNGEIRFMSAVAEAAFRLRQLAEPRPVGDRVKTAIGRAAKLAGLSFPRAENLWYGEARTVRAEEMDAIRRAEKARAAKEQAARDQAEALGALFAGVAERLRTQDEDFHREDVASLLDAASALGALGRAVDWPEGE